MERRREFEDIQNLPITSTETKVRNIIIHTNPKRPSLTITSTETKLEISSYTKTLVEPSLTIFVSQRVEPPSSSLLHIHADIPGLVQRGERRKKSMRKKTGEKGLTNL
jgi:hypothetical protein